MPSYRVEFTQDDERLATIEMGFRRDGDHLVNADEHSFGVNRHRPVIVHVYEPDTGLLLATTQLAIDQPIMLGSVVHIDPGAIKVQYHQQPVGPSVLLSWAGPDSALVQLVAVVLLVEILIVVLLVANHA